MNRLAALIVPLLVAACTTGTGTAASLHGTTWRLERIDGQAAASPHSARLRFERDTIGASVGCNSIGGDYRVERQRLIAGPLVRTEMYCEGRIGAQEEALSALLVGAPQVSREGDRLTLASSGHRAEFVRLSA